MMKVALLEHTPNPETVVATAAHQCVSSDDAELFNWGLQLKHPKHSNKIIRAAISKGHTSVLEHVSFTFSISGVSRSLTHQLVRFRIASFSQQSQRYCKIDTNKDSPLPVVIPPTIQDNPEALEWFEDFMVHVAYGFDKLVKLGIPQEDARFVLPNACETAIIMTMNVRELLHLFSLRCCEHAQWEIREMAWKILELVKPILRVAFDDAGPACFRGPCPEGDRCCGGSKHVRAQECV